jgi:nitrite reductase/ring-hydroxylating ferredoxin subunit
MDIQSDWHSYSSAPPAGTPVCSSADVAEGRVLSISVESEKGTMPLLLTRRAAGLYAFVNACPHQYLPLDYQGSSLLSADGTMLMCASHGARFTIADGQCVDGPAMGCGLDRVPLLEADGTIRIG